MPAGNSGGGPAAGPGGQAGFEAYRDSYADVVNRAVSFAGQDLDHYTEIKAGELLRLCRACLGDPAGLSALDLGCGVGLTDRFLLGRFGRLQGVDREQGLVDRARESNPGAAYAVYDGVDLPFGDGAFDLVFAINVFHHVPPAERPGLLREMGRVTAPGGLVAVFEHNPLNPGTRMVVRRVPFDRDAVLLRSGPLRRLMRAAGLRPVRVRYIVFFPFRGRVFRRLERLLGWLPLGAQHYVAARKA